MGIEIPQINKFVTDSLFMTITNANFDKDWFITRILMGYEMGNATEERLLSTGGTIERITFDGAYWREDTEEEMAEKALETSILSTEN